MYNKQSNYRHNEYSHWFGRRFYKRFPIARRGASGSWVASSNRFNWYYMSTTTAPSVNGTRFGKNIIHYGETGQEVSQKPKVIFETISNLCHLHDWAYQSDLYNLCEFTIQCWKIRRSGSKTSGKENIKVGSLHQNLED